MQVAITMNTTEPKMTRSIFGSLIGSRFYKLFL
jgi:hypothetical protein